MRRGALYASLIFVGASGDQTAAFVDLETIDPALRARDDLVDVRSCVQVEVRRDEHRIAVFGHPGLDHAS